MADVELVVREDAQSASEAAAERLAAAAAAGGNIALSGGSAASAYELAAALQPDWNSVELWWADERLVPPDDERSNYRLVRASLLDRLAVRPRAVHRVETERSGRDAATRYDESLTGIVLNFAFLGLGADGHTASLFPHAPELQEHERRAVLARAALEPFVDRVTLTLPVLSAAHTVLFLVTGEAKAEAVKRAFAAPPTPAAPASLVRSTEGRTIVILDRAAAGRAT